MARSISLWKRRNKMLKRLEEFLFGKIAGRAIARLALSAVSGVAAFLAGKGIELTPDQQAAAVTAVIGAANSAYSTIKEWREARAAKAAPAK
jgi:hypothetical protein